MSRKYLNKGKTHFLSAIEGLTTLLCLFAIFAIVISNIGYDLELHCFDVAQVLQGRDVLISHFADLLPLKYHDGYDRLMAAIIQLTGYEYPYVATFLMIVCSVLSVVLLAFYLHQVSKNVIAFAFPLFAFFLSSYFYGIDIHRYLQVGSMFYSAFWSDINQSSWLFALPLLLFIVIMFRRFPVDGMRHAIVLSSFSFAVGLFAPVLSATLIFLVGMVLGYCSIVSFINRKFKQGLVSVVAGILLLVIWKLLAQGVFVYNNAYESPHLTSIFLLSGAEKVLWAAAYYIWMQPLSFIAFLGSFYYYKNHKDIFRDGDERGLLVFLVWICYPLPFIVYFDNILMWDNFCKFNLLGAYAGLIFFVWLLNDCWSGTWKRLWIIPLAVLSFFVFRESLLRSYGELFIDNHFRVQHQFLNKMNDTPELDSFLFTVKDRDASFLVIPRKDEVVNYKWDIHDRSFAGMFAIADRYRIISWKHGFRTLNYYDLNHLVEKSRETRFIQAMDEVQRGDYKHLSELHPDYILLDYQSANYRLAGGYSEISSSAKEGWKMLVRKKN